MMLTSLVTLLVLFQAGQGRPYSEERQLLDRHLNRLARALPDAPAPGDDETLLVQLATEAGLRDIAVGGATITETGSLGQSRRTLTATATYPDTDRFFRALQGSPRLIDVESLTLRSGDFGVSIEARVRVYHRPAGATSAARLDPSSTRDRTRGATREEAARFARDELVALEKTIALDDLRRRQTSPRMFLAETGAAFRDAPAALTFASLDGDSGRFNLRGVVAGMGAADSLERRLEGGFFRLREFSRAQQGGCFQFEAVGESFRAGPQAALPLPIDEPFRPTETLCRQDRDPGYLGEPGTVLRASGSAPGGLSLRATDLDLADVGALLEVLSGEPFVIAEGVAGRANLDFAGVSVEEALRSLPVRVDRVGAVWLLRPAGDPGPPPQEAEADAPGGGFSLRAKRTRGEEVLSALADIDPGFAALGPPALPRISIFAHDAPAADVRRAALSAMGLLEERDENSRVLRFQTIPGPLTPVSAGTEGRIVFRSRDLTVEELRLVGIGRSSRGLAAFVYSPLGEIVTVRLGDAISGGTIAGIDSNGMLVDSAEGPLRISLPAPRPK